MSAVAIAAFPVAVGLLLLAGVARALLEWSEDADFTRLARNHLEPLTTWCLSATLLYVGARAASGDIGIGTVILAVVIGGAALVLRDSSPAVEEDEPLPEPAPQPQEPTRAPVRSTGPLWAGRE